MHKAAKAEALAKLEEVMKPLALMAGVDTNAPTIKQASKSLGTEGKIRINTADGRRKLRDPGC